VNDYESLDGLFAEIKDELIEKNVAERLWELFDSMSAEARAKGITEEDLLNDLEQILDEI